MRASNDLPVSVDSRVLSVVVYCGFTGQSREKLNSVGRNCMVVGGKAGGSERVGAITCNTGSSMESSSQ